MHAACEQQVRHTPARQWRWSWCRTPLNNHASMYTVCHPSEIMEDQNKSHRGHFLVAFLTLEHLQCQNTGVLLCQGTPHQTRCLEMKAQLLFPPGTEDIWSLGLGCYWHPGSGSQWCHWAMYGAQDGPTTEDDVAHDAISEEAGKKMCVTLWAPGCLDPVEFLVLNNNVWWYEIKWEMAAPISWRNGQQVHQFISHTETAFLLRVLSNDVKIIRNLKGAFSLCFLKMLYTHMLFLHNNGSYYSIFMMYFEHTHTHHSLLSHLTPINLFPLSN